MKKSTLDKELRKRAEAQVGVNTQVADTALSGADMRALLHELEVHQVELELQNEELLLAQAEVKAGLEQYRDLYDYAPVGYFSFDHDGSIRKVNLTGALMLLFERSRLIGRRMQMYLTSETRGSFTAFLERVFLTNIRLACEVALHFEGGKPVFVRIEAEASKEGQFCLAAVTDITERRQLAEKLQNAHDKLEETVDERTRELTSVNMQLMQEIEVRKRAEESARKSEQRITLMDRISTIFLTVADDEVYGEVLQVVLDAMKSRFGIFGFIAENGDLVIPSLTREVWDTCQIPDKKIAFPSDTWGKSLWGRAIREKTAFYVNETFHPPEGHIPIDNFLAVPIIFGDKVIGLLSAGNKDGGYSEEDKEMQIIIASRISPILKARQQRDLQKQGLLLAKGYNRRLIEASLDPFVAISPAGKVTDVNYATEKVTGYSREELIGTDFSDYFTEPEKARTGYQQAFCDGTVRDYLLQIKHRDGHVTSVIYNAAVFLDENGECKGVFAAARDITEQKALETQLFQAQKMEAIGQFAGGIAHDFNNALTVIIGFTNLMEMQMDKVVPLREYISHVLSAANKAAELTRSLLAFSRKQIMNIHTVDLNQILENVEKFLHRIIGEDIALKIIIHQDLLAVNADSGQIEQVLMNLAVNARDAMPHGGILTIETRYALMDSGFNNVHGFGEAGEYALVTITDSGTGMDDVTRKRLFEPFFTTKELGKGTGLGLSIVYGIVKQHNGFIDVDSEPGVGTTFSIYLPLTKAKIKEHADQVDERSNKGTETLLVADDDASILELTVKVLEQFGYTVITAIDGLDVVNKFSENREKIALVILDVMMPKMNGKEAYDEIRKISPDMKAIFVSGYTADIIHSRGTLDESLEYIAKPLKFTKLMQKVREVLDGK
jgi:PAS domain S-box-containing protein